MKFLKLLLKILGVLVLFTLISLLFVYLTLDLSRLSPSIEALGGQVTGAEVRLGALTWPSPNALYLERVSLEWPLTPEEREAVEAFREAKKAERERREAGEAADPSAEPLAPPPQPLKVCFSDVRVSVDLWAALAEGVASGSFEGLLFGCDDAPGAIVESTQRVLRGELTWQHEGGLWAPVTPKGSDLKVRATLSELNLADVPWVSRELPLKVDGAVTLEVNLDVPLTRQGAARLRAVDGEVRLDATGVRNEKGLVGAFEVPKLALGEVKLALRVSKGQVDIDRFTTRSADLSGEVTGGLGVRTTLRNLDLKTHVALELSPEFVQKTPEIKTLAMLQRRFFTPDGQGYKVGVELAGSLARPRATPREFSPYSKSGRAQQRERKPAVKPAAKPAPKPSAKPAARPAKPPAPSSASGGGKGLFEKLKKGEGRKPFKRGSKEKAPSPFEPSTSGEPARGGLSAGAAAGAEPEGGAAGEPAVDPELAGGEAGQGAGEGGE